MEHKATRSLIWSCISMIFRAFCSHKGTNEYGTDESDFFFGSKTADQIVLRSSQAVRGGCDNQSKVCSDVCE